MRNRQAVSVASVILTLTVLSCAPAVSHAQAAKAGEFKQTSFPDGTGTIGLAPGWRIDNSYRGAVTCVGPSGALIVLKLPWMILRPEGSVAQLPSAAQHPVARSGDLVGALREVLLKKGAATLKRVRGKRLGDVAPGSPAYLLLYEFVQNGKAMTGIGYFAALDYGADQPFWQLYSSAVIAPTAQFPKIAPTMLRMWKSWRPNGQEPQEGSASAVFDKIIQDRKTSYERIQKEFREQL